MNLLIFGRITLVSLYTAHFQIRTQMRLIIYLIMVASMIQINQRDYHYYHHYYHYDHHRYYL